MQQKKNILCRYDIFITIHFWVKKNAHFWENSEADNWYSATVEGNKKFEATPPQSWNSPQMWNQSWGGGLYVGGISGGNFINHVVCLCVCVCASWQFGHVLHLITLLHLCLRLCAPKLTRTSKAPAGAHTPILRWPSARRVRPQPLICGQTVDVDFLRRLNEIKPFLSPPPLINAHSCPRTILDCRVCKIYSHTGHQLGINWETTKKKCKIWEIKNKNNENT